MTPDVTRLERVTRLMTEERLDALICQLPSNLVMLSGYLPVFGASLLVFLHDGDGVVIAPETEEFFARDGWYPEVRTFRPETDDYFLPPFEVAAPLLARVCCEKGVAGGVIGIEGAGGFAPVSHACAHHHGPSVYARWAEMLPSADFRDATVMLSRAAAVKSPREIERITLSSVIARNGFEAAREAVRPGAREVEVAEAARSGAEVGGTGVANVRRVGAWAWCASGPRSGDPDMSRIYSTNRKLQPGDALTVRITCHADGYWTDMTRTFFLGTPSGEPSTAYEAVNAAWNEAFGSVVVGKRAADVDEEGRSALSGRGFRYSLPRGLGHGMGFSPSTPQDPMIHPESRDVLEQDMVFTLNPAIYRPGEWGISIEGVVALRSDEVVVLSDLRRNIEWATCA